MSSTRTRLSLRRRCFDMVSTCFAISRGRVTLRRPCFAAARFAVAILSSIYTILVQHENHMPTLLYSELQQQCRRLKPAPFRKGADRGAEAPHYPYSGSRNIVTSAPVRVPVPSLRDSGRYSDLPSTPPAAACWAKLFRPAKRDWRGPRSHMAAHSGNSATAKNSRSLDSD